MAQIKKISTELQLLDKFLDTSGDAGASGQVLTSTGTGINWVSAGTPGSGVYLPLAGGTLSGNLTIAHATNPYLYINDTDAGAGIFQQEGNTTRIGSDTDTQVVLVQDNSTAVTIDTSKNVGIGTTSPGSKLEIHKSITYGSYGPAAPQLNLVNTHTEGTAGFLLLSARYNNTSPAQTFYQVGGMGGGKETALANNQWGGYINFFTTSDGTAGAASGMFEHMRITADGFVGIGTPTPGAKLDVLGKINQTISSGGNAASFTNSDATSGYGVAIQSEGTANTRYALILRNLDGSDVYGGVSTMTNQVGFWGVGASPTATLGSRLTVGGNASIGTSYTGTAAPSNGMIVQGNVGIGTTSPVQKLSVISDSNSQTDVSIGNTGNGVSRLYIDASNGDVAGSDYIWFGQNNDLTSEIQITQNAGSFNLRSAPGGSSQTNFTMTQAGNIGIGTTSPGAKLVINSTSIWINPADGSHAGLHFRQADAFKGFVGYNDSADVVNFGMDGSITNGINVNSSHNVGIGTTSPSSKLEVYGSGSTVLDIQGSQGQLFSITDDLTGDLFSVSDISGVPILNVNSSGEVEIDGKLGIGATAGDFHADADDLVVGDGVGATGITIHSGTTGFGSIFFADGTADDATEKRGQIRYLQGTERMDFHTDNVATAALSLAANGNATFAGNVTIDGGQILTPGGVDLSLNPNTGLLNVGGVIRATGTGANKFTGGLVLGTPSNGNLVNKLTIASGTVGDGIFLTGLGNTTGMATGNYRAIDFQYSNTDASFQSAIRFVVADSTVHGGQIEFFTDNSSGTNTKALTLDKSQKATFSGNVDILTGASLVTLNIGRNSNEKLQIDQTDNETVLTANNDSDGDSTHSFRLNRVFAGTGANNFKIQKGGTDQFSLDTNANATFAGALDIRGSGYHQIKIAHNRTADTNKQSGIVTENYEGNNVSILQTFQQNNTNSIYYGSADSAFAGVQNHYFFVNADSDTATSGHTKAFQIKSDLSSNFYGNVTLKDTGVAKLKAAPLGATYGAGFDVMTVTGTSSAPYTSTIGFSNYGATDVLKLVGTNATFAGTISSGRVIATVGSGTNLEVRKGAGSGAVGFGGTAHQTGLIEGVDGGGLKLYTAGNDVNWGGAWALNTTWSGTGMTVAGNINVGGTVTMSASGNIFSDSIFQFLTTSSGAQHARFKGIQLGTSYSGTPPSEGILFGTDTNLYRNSSNVLKTDDSLVVTNNFTVGGTITAGDITGAELTSKHAVAPVLKLRREDTDITTGESIGSILFQGDDPSATNTGAAILGQAAGTWNMGSPNVYPSKLVFQTAKQNTLLTAFVIDENQNGTFESDLSVKEELSVKDGIYLEQGDFYLSSDGTNHIQFKETGNGLLTIDAPDDITLDAGGGDIILKDDNTEFGLLANTTNNFVVMSRQNNKDLIFKGIDNSTAFTALTLDMSEAGKATFNNDVIAFSDRKLKKDIKTLDGSKVYDMRGVSYVRKDTGNPGAGVVAQEIQKVAPELVNETNGTLGVSYGNITGYLIEAIKDLKAEIEELKSNNCNCKK